MSSKVLKQAQQLEASKLAWPQLESRLVELGPGKGSPPDQDSQAEARVEAAAREAYQRGYADGEAAARAALEPVLGRLAQSLEQLSTLGHRLRRQAEADLVHLALAIARRVLRRELSADPEAVAGIVRAALDRLQGQEVQRVRVHPALEEALKRALRQVGAPASLTVIADRGCQPGDVILETAHGDLDASVETQLQEIERGLADRLRHG
jgi:flagellar assembly protein FliH